MGFGYLSAAIIALIVLLALRKYMCDRALWRRVKKNLPQAGAAGTFRVLTAGSRRLPAGEELRIPFEGTLGAAMSCDVCIPYKKVHMRSAFFWMEGEELHMVPLHKDGFQVDDTPDEPYVTRARRSKAEQGRGDGLGAPGRGEIRREKKRLAKQKNNMEENMKKTRR